MTRRGAALVLIPTMVIAFAALVPILLLIAGTGLVAAVALIVIDYATAPSTRDVRVTRQFDTFLSAGAPNSVRIRIDSDVQRHHALIRDEHPLQMAASDEVFTCSLPGEFTYTLTPSARGEGEFLRTVVRTTGRLGLAIRQCGVGAPQKVRVDPNISALQTYDALARRGQLAELGVQSLRNLGEGTEFERVREAAPDDPLRAINWPATARTGRLMATQWTTERAQPVIICLDHGRLMGVGAGELTKLDHSINAALLLAHVALRYGDHVGVMTFADTVTGVVTPKRGYAQMRSLLDAFRPLTSSDIESDYRSTLNALSTWNKQRALLVIFTDIADTDQGMTLLAQCVRLRQRHLPLVVTVRDPALEDMSQAHPINAATTYSRALANGLIRDRQVVVRHLQRSAIDVLDVDARTLSPGLINQYLEIKARARL